MALGQLAQQPGDVRPFVHGAVRSARVQPNLACEKDLPLPSYGAI